MKSYPFSSPGRCAIVLAAGDGQRLQPFICKLRGDTLPKQYANIIGKRSMLEHTWDRVQQIIPAERIFTIVGQHHLQYPEVRQQLSRFPKEKVVLQPENKETAPGLLLPLMHIYNRYPESVVVAFPSDHFILQEALFMWYVELACRVVELNPSLVLLLGVSPDHPDPGMGYIVPGGPMRQISLSCVQKVLGFVEKPDSHKATELMRQGGLWNTLVMVFRAKTLLQLTRTLTFRLYQTFHKIRKIIGSPKAEDVLPRVYRRLMPMNFSESILQLLPRRTPSQLAVIPVRGVLWSDWGSEERILNTLQMLNQMRLPFANGMASNQRVSEARLVSSFSNNTFYNQTSAHHGNGYIKLTKEENAMSPRLKIGEEHSAATSADLILKEENIRDRIAQKAYELWEADGRVHGHDVEDWLEAERIILAEFTSQNSTAPSTAKGQVPGARPTRKRAPASHKPDKTYQS